MDILGHSECASKADVWWDYEVQSPPKGVGGLRLSECVSRTDILMDYEVKSPLEGRTFFEGRTFKGVPSTNLGQTF